MVARPIIPCSWIGQLHSLLAHWPAPTRSCKNYDAATYQYCLQEIGRADNYKKWHGLLSTYEYYLWYWWPCSSGEMDKPPSNWSDCIRFRQHQLRHQAWLCYTFFLGRWGISQHCYSLADVSCIGTEGEGCTMQGERVAGAGGSPSELYFGQPPPSPLQRSI